MKLKYFFIIIVLFTGCRKEQQTNYTADIKNSTQHFILILPFKGGIVYPPDTIKLSAGQQFQIADGFYRGLITEPLFFTKYFGGPNDSIVIVFDNLYKVSHYANPPQQKARKYYLFESLRHIANAFSYKFESTTTSKNHRNNTHLYVFTQEDY